MFVSKSSDMLQVMPLAWVSVRVPLTGSKVSVWPSDETVVMVPSSL